MFDQFFKFSFFSGDNNNLILAKFKDKKSILVHRFAPRNYTPGKDNHFN